MAWPSGPAFSTHSAVIFSPTLSSSACSASGAGWTFILLALSCSMYHAVFSSETFQPRSSAAAAAFTPVFNLVGRQSISYERVTPACSGTGGNNYAIVFAQTNLLLIAAQLERFAIDGVAFIMERNTSLLLAASVPDQTVSVDPASGGEQRVPVGSASNKLVRDGGLLVQANLDSLYPLAALQADGLVVFAQPYEYADAGAALGWINVVVLRKQDYVTVLYHGRNAALYAVLIVVTFLLAMLITGVLVWLGGRSKSALSSSASQQPLSGGDELK